MKKGWKLLLGAGLLVMFGCKDVQERLLPSFTVSIPPINLRIPPLPIIAEKEIPVGALRTPINLDSAIKANTAGTFGANAVHSIKVKNITLEALDANETNNLSNFESARIRIFTDTSFVDIANIYFPKNATTSLIVVPSASPDISSYLKGSVLSYNLFWKNRRATGKLLKMKINIQLEVQ